MLELLISAFLILVTFFFLFLIGMFTGGLVGVILSFIFSSILEPFSRSHQYKKIKAARERYLQGKPLPNEYEIKTDNNGVIIDPRLEIRNINRRPNVYDDFWSRLDKEILH